ncbi:hypothetical protein RRG08_023625 [Elysia crispata]|uniref:Uncharacterized protein n=1 Tax=Elysia crispata TaxID=231223 RepID=A0AAE0XSG5_9GAST|nr:hypothetical protein RRG08_023625 [Elysia crispata]
MEIEIHIKNYYEEYRNKMIPGKACLDVLRPAATSLNLIVQRHLFFGASNNDRQPHVTPNGAQTIQKSSLFSLFSESLLEGFIRASHIPMNRQKEEELQL